MPSGRKQFNVRMSDETAARVGRLFPVVSAAVGVELSQAQFFALAVAALEEKCAKGGAAQSVLPCSGMGRQVKQIREEDDPPYTQEQLAQLSGLPLSRIQAIEAGAEPTHGELTCIAAAYDTPHLFLSPEESDALSRAHQERRKPRPRMRSKK